eukprot:TRINITY_DN14275_c0_g1_i1.p1 TRINITY_DN14275_c0_g1~~TRINITY_DN14275_c0_g1_i1.p1  ORF type:complete len:184 (+),score=44.47 TRINITY_DN14275_c0_g1_i1:42-593(+)
MTNNSNPNKYGWSEVVYYYQITDINNCRCFLLAETSEGFFEASDGKYRFNISFASCNNYQGLPNDITIVVHHPFALTHVKTSNNLPVIGCLSFEYSEYSINFNESLIPLTDSPFQHVINGVFIPPQQYFENNVNVDFSFDESSISNSFKVSPFVSSLESTENEPLTESQFNDELNLFYALIQQ